LEQNIAKRPMQTFLNPASQSPYPPVIRICTNDKDEMGGPVCGKRGGAEIKDELEKGISDRGIDITISTIACMGYCSRGPALMLDPGTSFIFHAGPEDVPEILNIAEKLAADAKALNDQ